MEPAMKRALPQSRFLVGLIVGIEGLAVWVVAIFLASYSATGSITWPGADLYTTSIGTMSAWISSPGFGGYELLAYFGLVVSVFGPGWFWVGKSVIERDPGRRGVPREAAIQGIANRDQGGFEDEVNWIPASEIAADSTDEADYGKPSWATKVIDTDQSSRPDAIEQRLAAGDFFRGSGAKGKPGDADDERENANEYGAWSFGAPTDE